MNYWGQMNKLEVIKALADLLPGEPRRVTEDKVRKQVDHAIKRAELNPDAKGRFLWRDVVR